MDENLVEPWGPIELTRSEIEEIIVPTRVEHPRRFNLILSMKGVTWARVQVELAPDEGQAGNSIEWIPAPPLGGFGLPSSEATCCLAMQYQIAQKIHAVSDPHDPPESRNDRPRDIVDVLLLKELVDATAMPTYAEIGHACQDVFAARAADARQLGRIERHWPPGIEGYPHWVRAYADAQRTARFAMDMDDALIALNAWICELEASL